MMKQRILLERAALLALLLLLFTSTALFAQQAGSLRGQVSDQSGGVIPGATVTITKAGVASAERATQVTGEGVYQFDNVAPGAYTVKVSAAGFAPLQKDDVVIAAGKRTALDITLEVTLEKQKVEVVSEPPVSVEADNNANAVVLKEKDMEALPDDPDELSDVLQAMAGPSAGPNGGQFFIDGFTGATLPPKEAIREIRINSNPFSSEYDRLGFGRIEIFTKPGMDKFHGSANFNYTDDNLNTRFPYVSNRPSYMRRMYNGNLTGPLLKNRASFFVSFSGRQIDDNAAVVATILDPNFNVTSFQQAVVTPQRRYETNARLDLKLNDKNTLVASYSYETNSQSGQGVSGFSLPTWNGVSRAFSTDSGEQSIRATETMIVNPTTINETRFQFMYPNSHRASGGVGPQISVSGAFTGGGTGFTDIFNNSDRFELQNYTTKAFAKHSLKFGVRLRGDTQDDYSASNFNGNYIFSGVQNAPVLDASNQVVPGAFASITSIEQYRRTVLFQSLGFTPTQIRALGGMPNQLTLNAGNPDMGVNQVDAGVFAQDDWRFRSNLTISTGLRYEQQTNISSNFNFAPRIAFAWSPSAKGMAGKTVVRGGFGIFYDRIGEGTTLNTLRYNGVNEQAFLVQPTSQTLGQTGASLLNLFPALPSVSALSQFAQGGTLYRLQNGAQAPYNVVASVSVERTLPKNVVVSTSYIRSRFVHMQMERNINAPLPGTVTSSNPSGILPYGNAGNLYEYETAGMYEQNQLLFSVNERFTRNFNLFSWYTYSRARSNTDGGFPSNMYDVNADWGRASGDMRHRLFVGGSVTLPKGVTLFPLINIHSGSPFNITSGLDPLVNGLSGFTERPAFAPNLSAPGMKVTPYGAFILNPGTGQAMIPRNYGEGPGFIGVNLRIAKSFGVGPKIESAQNSQQGRDRQQRMMTGGAGGPGGGGGGPRGGGGGGMRGGGGPGGGPGGFGGGGNSGRRYTLTVSANAENILNHVNAGNPIGNLSSPLFGQSQTLAGGGGFGGGGNSAAGNRRIDLQIRFNF